MYTEYLNKIAREGKLRNRTDSTIKMYQDCVSHFLTRTNKIPDSLTGEEVRAFLSMKLDEGIKPRTFNLYNSSIHFFFRYVLHQPWDEYAIPRMKLDYHLPTVLSLDEVNQLLDATTNLKYKAILSTMYSSGLRVSEVLHLHYSDISRSKMQIYVRQSKSRSDRYTILSTRNLETLTSYWFACNKSMGILFPNRNTKGFLSNSSVAMSLRRSLSAAGLNSNISSHDLRHSFATHLMEAGVEFRYIQALLGHRDSRSTELYLHTSNKSILGITSPFDKKDGDWNA